MACCYCSHGNYAVSNWFVQTVLAGISKNVTDNVNLDTELSLYCSETQHKSEYWQLS